MGNDVKPMRIERIFLFSILTSGIALGWVSWASSDARTEPTDLQALSLALGSLSERVQGATVFLEVNQGATGQGTGTGFVIDSIAGIVVTNAHVMRDAKQAGVRFADGRQVIGQVLGVDRKTDLAVLNIPPGSARQQLHWGDSDLVRPGNLVMAVGSPLRNIGTTSLGVVSALGRKLNLVDDAYEDFMQFDAFIDRGSSGGPLVNMDGQVIGINTAIGGESSGAPFAKDPPWRGISYAVPSSLARRFVADIIEHGEVRRGWLGASTEKPLDAGRARLLGLDRPYGAEIKSITAGGPADKAGLRKGDVILAIDGREVANPAQLKARIGVSIPGAQIRVKVLSKHNITTLRITVGELTDDGSE